MMDVERKPKIAILRWEEGLVPEGLLQLETLPGNSTNRDSYSFSVKLIHVPGACTETVITNPSEKLLNDMIEICKGLKEEGIQAISTSCGFNAIFQRRLAAESGMPIFSSALMQIPFVQAMIGSNKAIAVLTANKSSLTARHLAECGIKDTQNIKIYGLEKAKEWSKIFDEPDKRFDIEKVEQEIIGTALKAVSEGPKIGAIVLECTDLPPFAKKIREATGLPVFDFVSMINHVAIALGEINPYGHLHE